MIAWRKLIITAVLLLGVGALFSSLAKTFSELISFQIVLFLGFAPLSALLVALAINLFPPAFVKRLFLLFDIVALLGMVCGALLATLSIASLPWMAPLLMVWGLTMVLAVFVLDIKIPINSPQKPTSNLESQTNPPQTQKKFNPRFLLLNIILNIVLGILIYYTAQILLSPNDLIASLIILSLLAVYDSHLLYSIFQMNSKNRSYL